MNKTGYADGNSGLFMGYVGDNGNPEDYTFKMDMGSPANYLRWTGTGLEILGTLAQGSSIQGSLTKIITVTDGNRSITYNSLGESPEPNSLGTFTANFYSNGSLVTTGVTYSWTSAGVASGTDTAATFSPTLNQAYQSTASYVDVQVTYDSVTLQERIPITVVKQGPQGQGGDPGTAAKVVTITPSTQAVVLKADGKTDGAQTITFTTETQGTLGTLTWSASANGAIQNVTTGTLTFADNTTYTFPMTVTFGDGTTQDKVTIIGVKPGANGDDAVSAFLTNETHTVAADKDGNVLAGEFTNATTDIKIFVGTTDDTSNWSITYAGTNITLSSGNVFPITAMSADSGTVTITGTKTGFSNVVKTFTVTKARQGTKGENGTAAKVVIITPSTQAIILKPDGKTNGAQTITFTTSTQGTLGTLT
jgi:hypothetical protein